MIEEEKSSSRSDLTSIVPVEVTGNSCDENISIDIIEHVGVGGFSNVYVGRMHIGASESIYPVAIKQILKKIPRSYACYQRELNSLNALSNSPYIIKLFGWVECNRYYSLLLGYSKHGDLCNFIMKRGKLDDGVARAFLLQILSGLSFIHSKGMCHCDLKPDNILLDACNLVICDFGLARPIQAIKDEDATISGSGYNIAPEMYKCPIYNERCDLWAIGCILFIMLTGAPPLIEATKKDLLFTALCRCMYFCDDFYDMHDQLQLSWDKKQIINGLLHVQPMKRSTIATVLMEPWMRSGDPVPSYQQILQTCEQN